MRPADAARAAFAIGYARWDAPLTERAAAGCRAAMALAEANPHEGIVEATLRLGSLEGVWAAVYHRREKLQAKHAAALAKAWKRAARHLDIPAIVRQVASLTHYTPEAADPTVVRTAKGVIDKAVGAIADTSDWENLWATTHDALVDAAAEGRADALAQLADLVGGTTIDFDMAFDDAVDSLRDLDDLWSEAKGWLGRQVDGLTGELGNTLAKGMAGNTPIGDLERQVADLLGTSDNAAGFVLDQAIGQSISNGLMAVYTSEGLDQVDFITAGDDRVCGQCQPAEDDSPYATADAPTPPLHGRCRCTLAPAADSTPTLRSWEPYVHQE